MRSADIWWCAHLRAASFGVADPACCSCVSVTKCRSRRTHGAGGAQLVNLFIDTSFERAAEDRLTNAWMSVLCHADRSLLSSFLALANVHVDDAACRAARFDLQVMFPTSRPDARIALPELDVVIETKHTAEFDPDQFARHAGGMRAGTRTGTLVALTGHILEPPGFDVASKPASVPTSHVSWHAVAALLSVQEGRHQVGSASHLLVSQMRQYLATLGYREREKTTMQELNDLAAALARHRGTVRAAEGALAALAKQLAVTPGAEGLRWRTGRFRAMDFDYLDARPPEATFEARLRIYPQLTETGEFGVKYYLTFAPKVGTEAAQAALLSARTVIQAECGAVEAFGVDKNDHYFRVVQRLPTDVVAQMYGGEPVGVAEAALRMGKLFGAIRRALC